MIEKKTVQLCVTLPREPNGADPQWRPRPAMLRAYAEEARALCPVMRNVHVKTRYRVVYIH